jgi:hypothetical protein
MSSTSSTSSQVADRIPSHTTTSFPPKVTKGEEKKEKKGKIEHSSFNLQDEEDEVLIKSLENLGLDAENYEIVSGLAIYKGKVKNYVKVRENFEAKIVNVFKTDEKETKQIAGQIADFVNLGGTSTTKTNLVRIKEKVFKLDELTSALDIKKRVGTGFQEVGRDIPTIASVAAAYADHTRQTLRKSPQLVKIKELGELGFTNSFYCSQLREEDYNFIYMGLLDFEFKWDAAKRGGVKPTRFSERMFFYCTLVLKQPETSFNRVKQNHLIKHGLLTPPPNFNNQPAFNQQAYY